MKWMRALLLFIGLLGWSALAQASVNLVTDHSIGTPLTMDAGTVSSDTMILSLNSDAADLLLGWQTTLWILPTGGTGSVGFNSSVEPVNYVFGTRSIFFIENLGFPVDNDGMFAADANVSFLGGLLQPVTIPTSPGLNILELDFSASLDASGTFGVFAVGGAGRSEWTDGSIDLMLFNNINPTFDSHTQIGEIFVAAAPGPGAVIPEPSASLLFGAGTLVVGRAVRRRATPGDGTTRS